MGKTSVIPQPTTHQLPCPLPTTLISTTLTPSFLKHLLQFPLLTPLSLFLLLPNTPPSPFPITPFLTKTKGPKPSHSKNHPITPKLLMKNISPFLPSLNPLQQLEPRNHLTTNLPSNLETYFEINDLSPQCTSTANSTAHSIASSGLTTPSLN